jgi:hypothetical protein
MEMLFQVWTKDNFISLIENKPKLLIQVDGMDEIHHICQTI